MAFISDMFDQLKNQTIFDAMIKCESILRGHTNIMVSISGGSDSDVMLDMIERCKFPHNKIDYVFFDTGIEYLATKNHLDFLEEKYNIKIYREKARKSIPISCRDYGQPFLSKQISEFIYRLQSHNFKWEDKDFEELNNTYPKCKSALMWWCNAKGENSSFNIERRKWLKEFLITNPPNFKISSKCCEYAKKQLDKKWKSSHEIDLSCTGIRRAEGGVRAQVYKTCYDKKTGASDFRPIFWFTSKDKEEYIKFFKVELSDCYTKYGLTRTGCSGCPYAIKWKDEYQILEKYEPKLAKAVRVIFKDSYEYTKKYEDFCKEMEEKYKLPYTEFRKKQKNKEI